MAELIGEEGRPGADTVAVAFADDAAKGELIRGLLEGDGIASFLQPTGINSPMVAHGLLSTGTQRVMVRHDRAEVARRLLYENLFSNEQDAAGELPDFEESEASGGPRSYGLIGGYARAWVWSVGAMALVFAVFLLLRSV